MFAKAYRKKSGSDLADYFMTEKRDECVRLLELREFASDDIREAFQSVDAMALSTKGQKPMLHVSVRNADGERLTDEQWLHVADRMEAKLGLSGQKRGIVLHINEETGDAHMHIGWSLVDEETSTLKRVPFYIVRLREVCRDMEREFGLRVLDNDRNRSHWIPTEDEYQQAKRLGVNLTEVRDSIRDCWERSDNGRSFQVALEFEGLTLARGDRRDLVVIDSQGGIHALGKRLLGVSAADVREKCLDIDRESVPNVEQAQHEQRTGMRDEHAANLAWENALTTAAIADRPVNAAQREPSRRDLTHEADSLGPAVLDDVTRNRATFTRSDIERALKPDITDKADREALARLILKQAEVVDLGVGQGRTRRYTTETVIEGERHVLNAAAALHNNVQFGVPQASVDSKAVDLSPEKQRALSHVMWPGALAIVDGQAGTGKSTLLAAGKEIYEANGYHVVGLAPTNLVVQDLRQKGFTNANTIDTELWALSRGRRQWSNRTVVMVDEAAMVDTRRLGMILSYAQRSGAKVVLAGDDRQLPSIERGGMFEVLKQRHGAAELTEVHRQNASEDREASRLMAQGNFASAIAIYRAKDAIHWHDKQSEAATGLVDKYLADSAANPSKSRFIFAYTNKEVDQINAVVREARQAGRELGESHSFETNRGRADFAVGDRLQFTGTDRLRGIYNGQAGIVRNIQGSQLTVELDGRSQRAITFDVGEFKDFRHGYAGTIYRGQGRTIDQTYLLHSEYWRRASSYVGLTRHSEKTELFVARQTAQDLRKLAQQMSRLEDRRAATFYAKAEQGCEKPIAPDRLKLWYTNLDNCSKSARKRRVDFRASDEGIPSETLVGRLGPDDLREQGSIRRAFEAVARRANERNLADYSNAGGAIDGQRRRWRIGRDGRQR